VIKEVLALIERTAGKNIELRSDLPLEISLVYGDPGQIHQVIMNLCLNACDSMPDGGTLTVVTGKAELDERFFRIHPELKRGFIYSNLNCRFWLWD